VQNILSVAKGDTLPVGLIVFFCIPVFGQIAFLSYGLFHLLIDKWLFPVNEEINEDNKTLTICN
jgi:hypothetical protein